MDSLMGFRYIQMHQHPQCRIEAALNHIYTCKLLDLQGDKM